MSNPSDPFDFGPPAQQPGLGDPSRPAAPHAGASQPEAWPQAPQAPWQAEPGQAWHVEPGPAAPIVPVSAPTALLIAAAASVAVGAVLVLLAHRTPAAALAAWAAAGPVAIVLVGFFLGADADRRSNPYYVQQAWTRWAPVVIVATGLLVVVASSWFFADWAARQ